MDISGPQAPFFAAAVAGAIAYFSVSTDEFMSGRAGTWVIGSSVVIGFIVGCLLRRRDVSRESLDEQLKESTRQEDQ